MMFAQDASGGYRGADYVLLRSPDAGAPPPQAAAREHIVPNVPAWSRPLCTRMVSTAWCREADADYIAIVDVLLDAGATRAPSFNRWNARGYDEVEPLRPDFDPRACFAKHGRLHALGSDGREPVASSARRRAGFRKFTCGGWSG